MADSIKNTKIALMVVPCCRGNSNQGGKSGNFDAPITMKLKTQGIDLVESPGMSMSREAKTTIMLLHKSKMSLEFFLSFVQTLHKPCQVGIYIVTEEDSTSRSCKNIIEW